jgi:outer membrane protein, heavy metal efflux system
MRSMTNLSVASVVLLLSVSSAPAEPLRLSMDDVVARTIATNLDLRVSRKDVNVAEANLERSRPLLPSNPQFSVGAQRFAGFAPNYSFSLSQEFEVAGQRRARIQVAEKEMERASWDVKTAEQTLTATAKTAFIHALISIDRVTMARQGGDATADILHRLERANAASGTQRIQRNQASIQAARSARTLAWAEHARDSAIDALRGLLGLPADQEIVLTGAPQTEVRQLPSEGELANRALSRRSDVIALRQAMETADLRVTLARREGIPNVTLSGTFGRFESDSFAGGDFTVPLPVFQRKAPDIHEALAEHERATLQVRNLERSIANDVLEARRACNLTGTDLLVQRQKIVPLSEENLEIERGLFDRGAADTADVVGMQIDLQTARSEYLDAIEAYNNALIDLERVSGGSLSGGE